MRFLPSHGDFTAAHGPLPPRLLMVPGAGRFCRCARAVDRLLSEAGAGGRVLKAMGERWFGGHTVGLFEAKGMRREK
jgi:hypothetical protein